MPRASHSHTATTIFPVCVKPFPIFSHRMASRGGEECSSDASLGGGGPGCPKRRKASAGAEALWAVHCPDGAKFSVTVAEGERVAEVKRAIAALRGVPCFAFDLFIGGAADPLCGEQRLGRAGAAAKLFMLSKVVSDRLALAAIFKSTGGERGLVERKAGLGGAAEGRWRRRWHWAAVRSAGRRRSAMGPRRWQQSRQA